MYSIVFATDYAYKDYLETAIKSMVRYHSNITFYLINRDYPNQWFEELNAKLKPFKSVIVDKKLSRDGKYEFDTFSHISEATFYRYHIPELISEDKVLYLDADIILQGNIDDFYNIDLFTNSTPVAAVSDVIVAHRRQEKEFNAGVLLINNRYWREHHILSQALAMHANPEVELPDADQSVLNHLFKGIWREVAVSYNYQTCGSVYILSLKERRALAKLRHEVIIVHYTTRIKPWTNIPLGTILQRIKHIIKGRLAIKDFFKPYQEPLYKKEWHKFNQMPWEELQHEKNT